GRSRRGAAAERGLAGLAQELARLQEQRGAAGAGDPRLEAFLNRRLQDLSEMIRALVRAQLQRQDVTRGDQQRMQALSEKSFYYLSEDEIRRMQEAVTKLAQRLRNVISIRRRRPRPGKFDPNAPLPTN